jgi:hypothetical protein
VLTTQIFKSGIISKQAQVGKRGFVMRLAGVLVVAGFALSGSVAAGAQPNDPPSGIEGTAQEVADSEGADMHAEFVVTERGRLELHVEDGDAAYPLHLKTLLTGTADALWEELFSDDFESGDTGAWS